VPRWNRAEWKGKSRVADSGLDAVTRPAPGYRKEYNFMAIILLVLLLAIILGGLGFAIHVLWWIALAVLVLWLVGFLVRVGEGTSRGRWYRW
jgi:membrane protein YdbS with pleckstrin-like domain